MTEQQSYGGTEWELSAALDLVFAGRAADDEAAERVGWIRFSEGLRNVVQGILANQVIPITIQLRVVKEQLKEDEASAEHKFQMLISLAENEQREAGKQAARVALAKVEIVGMAERLDVLEEREAAQAEALKEHIASGDQVEE